MSIRITGKNVLVTGGTKGIGKGIALDLALAGANVVTCYRQDVRAAEQFVKELKQIDGDHHVVQADVSSSEDVDRLIEECRVRLGSLDAIVNNAGTISHIAFAELTPAEWHRVLDTNLTAAFLVSQRALPLLGKGSSIIHIGSRVATVGIPMRAHYTAAKAGLIGLARSMAKELGSRGIRVNVVAPGVITTEETASLSPEMHQRYRSLTALGRLGESAEIGKVVLFLASDLSSYVTGETIHVDGGI